MKQDIHPTFHQQAKITCVCGNSFAAGSTLSEIKVEICAKCHPFYTGQQRLVDTEGLVEKFQRKVKTAAQKKETLRKTKKVPQKETPDNQPRTLREMLQSATKKEK